MSQMVRSETLVGIVAYATDEKGVYLLDLIDRWAYDVMRFEAESSFPTEPARGYRNAYDFIGALHMRHTIHSVLRGIDIHAGPPTLEMTDLAFRRITVEDSTCAIGFGGVEVHEEPWWWRRIPEAGPIAKELSGWVGAT